MMSLLCRRSLPEIRAFSFSTFVCQVIFELLLNTRTNRAKTDTGSTTETINQRWYFVITQIMYLSNFLPCYLFRSGSRQTTGMAPDLKWSLTSRLPLVDHQGSALSCQPQYCRSLAELRVRAVYDGYGNFDQIWLTVNRESYDLSHFKRRKVSFFYSRNFKRCCLILRTMSALCWATTLKINDVFKWHFLSMCAEMGSCVQHRHMTQERHLWSIYNFRLDLNLDLFYVGKLWRMNNATIWALRFLLSWYNWETEICHVHQRHSVDKDYIAASMQTLYCNWIRNDKQTSV